VYNGNPRDGYYVYASTINEIKIKANEDQDFALFFVVALRIVVLNGFPKCRLKIFLNLSYEEELIVSLMSFWFYQAVDECHRVLVRDCKITTVESRLLEPSFFEPHSNAVILNLISQTTRFIKQFSFPLLYFRIHK